MRHNNSFVSEVLAALGDAANMLPRPFESPYRWVRRASGIPYRRYYNTVHHMQRRGLLRINRQKGKKFIHLTHKGHLEALFSRAALVKSSHWDGKWRMVLFDIPEAAHSTRDQIRKFLKRIGFIKLQASVFISPYALNREAVEYLRKSQLLDYIRIVRVDEMDDDHLLRLSFKVN